MRRVERSPLDDSKSVDATMAATMAVTTTVTTTTSATLGARGGLGAPSSRVVPVMTRTRSVTSTTRAFFGARDDASRDVGGKAGEIKLADVARGKKIGSGSFGDVYEGTLGGSRRVVLKEKRAGGGAFFESEAENNRRVRGFDGVATFIGVAGANAYLVWEDEGRDTLEDCFGGGAFGFGLGGGGGDGFARKLGCSSDAEASRKVAKQCLKAVKGLHDRGLIHRDVKPGNLLITRRGERLKLIDLGGAADLRTGNNFDESETIFDPVYGPPERYITGKFGGGGFGNVGWGKNKPDLFDSFSCGMTILQVSVPAFRKKGAMKAVRRDLKRWCYDCEAWRASLPERQQDDFAILDENNGAGWKLVCGLIANKGTRMSVSKALSSPFCR